jgi:hypothetical protein
VKEAKLEQLDKVAQSWIEKRLYGHGFIATPKSLQVLATGQSMGQYQFSSRERLVRFTRKFCHKKR